MMIHLAIALSEGQGSETIRESAESVIAARCLPEWTVNSTSSNSAHSTPGVLRLGFAGVQQQLWFWSAPSSHMLTLAGRARCSIAVIMSRGKLVATHADLIGAVQ